MASDMLPMMGPAVMCPVLTHRPPYLVRDGFICAFSFRIHPRDKQDVARRLTLGARAVAYNEKRVSFEGPFPKELSVSAPMSVNITYDQKVSVTPSRSIFEVRLAALHHV